ncbi:IclR family transcriptional regulator [Shinella pollutisoli]|uniref:IclR family transcriptional regulator n=1 Tax=Shinella pollutisoli TaxID=2250594 RepID=A0ABV7DG17_9HYPH|nr:IclR family transcriptional regulator [Shinella pollutisoli]
MSANRQDDDGEDEGAGAASRYRAPALDKGLDILEILADQSGGLTRTEIVRQMGLSPSQIFRMLERLVARGYVARLEGGDRYALTMKLFLLANRYPPLRRLVAQAQPPMDEFARETGQSCHLVVPEAGTGVIVAQATPISHWEFRARIGGQLDLFTTGSGQALIAFQRPERRAEMLALWGVAHAEERLRTITADLDAVRKAGYRAGPSSYLVGVTDLSAPICDPGGDAVAVLTCAYIEHPGDTGNETRNRALSRLRALAADLSSARSA